METISNSYPYEGTLSGNVTITFPLRVRWLEIINDNATTVFKYRFNESEDWATLNPLEVVSPPVKVRQIFLQGTTEYRIRAAG